MRIGIGQRRARLGVRHLLAAPARTAEEVAEGVVALHATDAASVYLSAAARLAAPAVAEVERALYDDRTLVRMLGMRRTVFVVPATTAPVVQSACMAEIARKERQQLVKHLAEQGYPNNVVEPERWLADVAESTARVLAEQGPSYAQDLIGAEPRLGQKLIMAPGKKYESVVNVTSRVLGLLAAEGRIVRGRPRGSWLSTQYEWSEVASWLGNPLEPWDPDAARARLGRQWLRSFGPATVDDLRWWTGWTTTQTRKVLADVGVVDVDLDGVAGIALPDDLEPVPEPEPWVALLPALDPTAMGWAERDFYLGPHRAALFDRSGNVGPTVWADGHIVGGWTQRPNGEVVVGLLEDVGSEAARSIDSEAARLAEWLGDTRITPKFRTPLERELSS